MIREGGEIEPVRVTRGAGDVLIESAGDSLLITGSPDKLDVLADTVEGQAEHPLTPDGRPAHTHVDYFPGHFYLHPDSVPVVITTRMAEPKGL
ncbi:hypothetical protein EV193_105282 [Herbihabitans rhizosphaerae]|uniref:Uncharacterized protein n=1 Tax=Herbihabitans rhizosphaerae TaxID=1872711 RepID=A0A4Q7KMZ5_9PSEU|nr:hypothetical protein EV193_105282 [Herbihabitans rhizosphaerae]